MEHPKLVFKPTSYSIKLNNWEEYYSWLKTLPLVDQFVQLRSEVRALNKDERRVFFQEQGVKEFIDRVSEQINHTEMEKQILEKELVDGASGY